jgi:signal transduction histidine kinase/CheY-like chemotaxis protein
MHYTTEFQQKTKTHFSVLLSFSHLEKTPLFFLNESEKIVACNEGALKLFEVENLQELLKKTSGLNDSFIDEQPYFKGKSDGWCERIVGIEETKVKINVPHALLKIYTMEVEHNRIDGYSYFIVMLRDTTMMDRARQAQQYFESFKQKFLHSISHEFRTPMNAIIGYTDLLEHTALNNQQNEYLDMIEKSSSSMMEKIANLLQLMELESGEMKLNAGIYRPIKEFEELAELFEKTAESKKIQLMFMIDPHLPKSLTGDHLKIKTVLTSLVDNAIKFTPSGGNVYVEIKIKGHQKNHIDVEFVVTDTGAGIPQERRITLLRPFAAAWENRERGINGLGIGLTLAHRLLAMMHSKLMLYSEVNKGSRFSFTITAPVNEKNTLDVVSHTKAAIWVEDHRLTPHFKLIKNYLNEYDVNAVEINGLATPLLKEVDFLFLLTDHITEKRISSIRNSFPKLKLIPVVPTSSEMFFSSYRELFDAFMTLPILPRKLYNILQILWDNISDDGAHKIEKSHENKNYDDIRILVAEDNPINLKLIETILKQEHYQVTSAENGQIAVDHYIKDTFDIVLMDIDMPVMDGVTANRLIKEINAHEKRPFTPVIALTAHALSGDRERIMKAGLDAHLPKPIDKELLLHTIHSYLQKKYDRAGM